MANITKKDLVEKISNSTGLTQVDTKIVVESFLEAVSNALRDGKNIEIRGFGRFKIKKKPRPYNDRDLGCVCERLAVFCACVGQEFLLPVLLVKDQYLQDLVLGQPAISPT